MPAKTTTPSTHMAATFYAIFDRRGFRRGAHGKMGPPALKGGERAVRMKVRIPLKAFEPEGVPTASIEVPESAVVHPTPEPTVTILPPNEVP